VKVFAADLHIHTALSPCGFDEMTPGAIVAAALAADLQLIAVCDHNAAWNCAPVRDAARGTGLAVIAGIEITTAEEAHVVGWFPDAAAACAAADEVLATLPLSTSASRRFGTQQRLGADGRVLGEELRMLQARSALPVEAAVALVHRHRGLAVAAHVDRPSYSVMSQLGLFPSAAGFDAVEVSAAGRGTPREDRARSHGLPVVTSSDSHFLSDVGICRTLVSMARPTFAELRRALAGEGGRGVAVA
jgi:hypothetical protein